MSGAGAGLIGNPTVPAIQPSAAHSSVAKQLGGKPADLTPLIKDPSSPFANEPGYQTSGNMDYHQVPGWDPSDPNPFAADIWAAKQLGYTPGTMDYHQVNPLTQGTLAAGLASTPLAGEVRQAVYESHPRVVSLQDPNFSNSYLGSYKVRPTIPDNNSDVPAAFSPANQTYGVNKQWATAPVIAGTTFADRLKSSIAGTLDPNPLKNTLTTPDPRKNVLTNPESAIGNAIGGKVGNVISHLNPLSWWD